MNVEESIPMSQIEQVVGKMVESRLQQFLEELEERDKLLMKKELSLMERVVRVEAELRSLREKAERK